MTNDDITAEIAVNNLRHELANPSLTEERRAELLVGAAEMIKIFEEMLENNRQKPILPASLKKEMHLMIRGISEVIEENE